MHEGNTAIRYVPLLEGWLNTRLYLRGSAGQHCEIPWKMLRKVNNSTRNIGRNARKNKKWLMLYWMYMTSRAIGGTTQRMLRTKQMTCNETAKCLVDTKWLIVYGARLLHFKVKINFHSVHLNHRFSCDVTPIALARVRGLQLTNRSASWTAKNWKWWRTIAGCFTVQFWTFHCVIDKSTANRARLLCCCFFYGASE